MAQYPTWAAGEDITADKLNSMLPLFAYKAALTARSSTTTKTDDPDLVLALAANATYQFEIWLFHTSAAAIGLADIKVGVNYTGTSSGGGWIGIGMNISGATTLKNAGQSIGTNDQPYGCNGGSFGDVKIHGSIFTTTAGNLSLQWAQNTSNASATNLRQGSYMRVMRMA